MKKLALLFLCGVFLSLSCKKAVDESIDCITELLFSFVTYTPNSTDPKEITLTLDYAGGFTVNIIWEYGDGTSESKTGTTTVHRYDSAGRYDVKANITLSAEDYSSCSTSRSETVDVY